MLYLVLFHPRNRFNFLCGIAIMSFTNLKMSMQANIFLKRLYYIFTNNGSRNKQCTPCLCVNTRLWYAGNLSYIYIYIYCFVEYIHIRLVTARGVTIKIMQTGKTTHTNIVFYIFGLNSNTN